MTHRMGWSDGNVNGGGGITGYAGVKVDAGTVDEDDEDEEEDVDDAGTVDDDDEEDAGTVDDVVDDEDDAGTVDNVVDEEDIGADFVGNVFAGMGSWEDVEEGGITGFIMIPKGEEDGEDGKIPVLLKFICWADFFLFLYYLF